MPDKEWHEDAWVRGWEPGSPESAGHRAFRTLRDTAMSAAGVTPESVAAVLGNPQVENELAGAGHDIAGGSHDAGGSHEEWMVVTESVTEDHAYYADENGYLTEDYDQAQYTTADYESFDSSPDSHGESY